MSTLAEMLRAPIVGELYRHYNNGRVYEVMHLAYGKPRSTLPNIIVYRDVEDGRVFARPALEWFERKLVGPQLQHTARFTLVSKDPAP